MSVNKDLETIHRPFVIQKTEEYLQAVAPGGWQPVTRPKSDLTRMVDLGMMNLFDRKQCLDVSIRIRTSRAWNWRNRFCLRFTDNYGNPAEVEKVLSGRCAHMFFYGIEDEPRHLGFWFLADLYKLRDNPEFLTHPAEVRGSDRDDDSSWYEYELSDAPEGFILCQNSSKF